MIRILVYCALAVSLFCGPRVDGGEFEVEGTVRQIVGNSTNRFLFRVTSWGERYQVWTRDYFESPTERVVGFDDRDFFHLDRLSDSSGKTVEFGHVHSGTVATHLFGVGDLLRLAFLERPRRPDGTHLTNVTLFALNEMLIGRHRGVVGTDSPNSATGYSEVRFLGSRSQGLADEFIGDFRTTDWTQHEGIVLPLRFALRSMMPMSLNPEVPPKTMEVLEGEVIRVGAPSISDALPRPMTPSVQIRDVRFLAETGGGDSVLDDESDLGGQRGSVACGPGPRHAVTPRCLAGATQVRGNPQVFLRVCDSRLFVGFLPVSIAQSKWYRWPGRS